MLAGQYKISWHCFLVSWWHWTLLIAMYRIHFSPIIYVCALKSFMWTLTWVCVACCLTCSFSESKITASAHSSAASSLLTWMDPSFFFTPPFFFCLLCCGFFTFGYLPTQATPGDMTHIQIVSTVSVTKCSLQILIDLFGCQFFLLTAATTSPFQQGET